VADVKGNKKQQVEENLAVYGPANPHERLNDSVSDVKRNKQKAFQ